jgi:hypothetical protein
MLLNFEEIAKINLSYKVDYQILFMKTTTRIIVVTIIRVVVHRLRGNHSSGFSYES